MADLAFTPAQLAKHWHVSSRTVYKMVEAGELGHIRALAGALREPARWH
jgi:excisionase family DNA binding protein